MVKDKSAFKMPQTNKKLKHIGSGFIRYFLLIIIGYIVIYPFLYMVSWSLKSEDALLDVSRIWIPKFFSFDSFKKAFEVLNFPSALKRTLLLQVVSAAIEVFSCSMIAYGFARFQFRGKKLALFFLIVSLLLPVQMYSLPLAVNYRQLDFFGIFGLIERLTSVDLRINIFDTNFTFWLPAMFGVGIRSGMIIYIYIQFYSGLPHELEEAAYVDGAGLFRTYFCIAVPSSSVAIVTVSVLALIWYWNENFLSALCFLNNNWPLSVALYNIEATLSQEGILLYIGGGKAETIIFAACILFIAIPLVTYLFFQRKFVKNIDRVGMIA